MCDARQRRPARNVLGAVRPSAHQQVLVGVEVDRVLGKLKDGGAGPTAVDLIAEEDMVITVSRSGYVKRSALTAYRAQRRGGRGRRDGRPGDRRRGGQPAVRVHGRSRRGVSGGQHIL